MASTSDRYYTQVDGLEYDVDPSSTVTPNLLIRSGRTFTFIMNSGSVTSGAISSGVIGQFHHASGSVTSGAISSGVVGKFHMSSGSINSGHIASGVQQSYPQICIYATTNENISGGCAVALNVSGLAWRAQSLTSGRMPAVGYTVGNTASGSVCEIIVMGIATPTSGLNNTRPGRPVYVNASGFVGNVSGGFLSGGLTATTVGNSGAPMQAMGFATHSGQIFVQPSMNYQIMGQSGTSTASGSWTQSFMTAQFSLLQF